jgi:hippurate hydrolase
MLNQSLLCLVIGIMGSLPCFAIDPDDWIQRELPQLIEFYVDLHRTPEVSFEERETAAKIASSWRTAGYEITTGVGGHGVVGLLENGSGPVVMLRTDLDALPVTEQTDLPYASTQTVTAAGGITSGVMHACGHDIHMTNLVGTAHYLAEHRDQWSGTLMLIGQPAEERGSGAQAMLDDGLFTRFPKPQFAVALHVDSTLAAGKVAVAPGYVLANVDSVDLTLKGRGGHGSAPHAAIDPIVQAAQLVLDLQTIVSREINPTSPAVVTVGAIHGGTKHNIISDSCSLQITVRSFDDETRKTLLTAIQRKAKAVAQSHRGDVPEIKISEGTPALRNEAALVDRLRGAFQKAIGTEAVAVDKPVMGGEDFSQYGLQGIPIVMYRLGAVKESRLERYKQLGITPPSLHSPLFYPDPEIALPTGIRTMIAAVLELMPK